MKAERILIVDDNPGNIALLCSALEPHGYEILSATSGNAALKIADRATPDLVLLDVMMPGTDGFAVCAALKANPTTCHLPVIFITARHETDSVVQGFNAGAVDYVFKPFQAEEIVSRVATHLNISRLTRELQERNRELEAEVRKRRKAEDAQQTAEQRLTTIASSDAQKWGLSNFVGSSAHLRQTLSDIDRLQDFGRTSVLITGESGTGKELVARAIHHQSLRAKGSFVAVNCVAVPSELAESLFFGHLKGAFTGALGDRKGYFEVADGGTLFLDEIGDMSPALQAKLLRVLEDGEITPVGAVQSRRVDVRIITATNVDLPAKIAGGVFRQDLYFRLARYSVRTPPVRERPEDIPVLAAHFLELFATEMGRKPPTLRREVLGALKAHSWPGNVRELKNVIERALILSGGSPICVEHLHLQSVAAPTPLPSVERQPPIVTEHLPLNLEQAEQALIQRALEQAGGNVAEAARLLGVNRSRIYRRFPQSADS